MFDRCRAWRSLLTRRAEGSLSPSERALLDDHINNCDACREAQTADDALQAHYFRPELGAGAGNGRAFDDGVITELRAMPLNSAKPASWRAAMRAWSAEVSFDFCMQLAGGGLAAAAVTAFVLVSALNPPSSARRLSAYEARTMSAIERNEPPVPLESLFQSQTPRAAMLWASPGRAPRLPAAGPHAAAPEKPARAGHSHSSRHGSRARGYAIG